jgi:hypothetical protein
MTNVCNKKNGKEKTMNAAKSEQSGTSSNIMKSPGVMLAFTLNMVRSKWILSAIMLLGWLSPAQARSDTDGGYFLSLKQKGQLIWRGEISDNRGNRYNIRICPGYVPPTRIGERAFRSAGHQMAEYVHIKKYRHARRNLHDVFEWTFRDCLWEFTIEGAPRAWGRYFENADRFAERRVFGWWMAYPWALFQSTVDTAFRVPVGLIGTAGGTVVGGVAVPARHTLNNVTASLFIVGFNGVLIPASGYTWNTVISPPLALFGQKPAESRVDGFWVRRSTTMERDSGTMEEEEFSEKELESVASWGKLLMDRIQPFADARDRAEVEKNETVRRLNEEAEKKKKELLHQEEQAYQKLLASPEAASLADRFGDNYSRSRVKRSQSSIADYLDSQGFTSDQRRTIIQLLIAYPPMASAPVRSREYTDPVKESIEVIKDVK